MLHMLKRAAVATVALARRALVRMVTLNAWNLAAFAPCIVDIDCAARVCPQALRRRPRMTFMARRAPCEPNNL